MTPSTLGSAPAKEPSLERSEEMAVGEGLIGVPARLSPPSQPPHSLRCSAVWPKPRCPDMVICLDTYTCISIYIYMRVHVTVSEMKARRENGNDDAHMIWLRSAYCACLLSITHTLNLRSTSCFVLHRCLPLPN